MKDSKSIVLMEISLDLFDGDAGGGAPGGAPAAAQAGAAAPESASGAVQSVPLVPPTRQGKKAGEFDNVRFGKQESAAGTAADTQTPEDTAAKDGGGIITESTSAESRRKAFAELINGEYKDVFAEETRRITERQAKESNALQQQLEQIQPVLDLLSTRYKTREGDIKALIQAIENDDAYWSEAAEEAGMSLEQFKAFQKLRLENENLRRAQRIRQGQEQAERQIRQWSADAQNLSRQFPGFNLEMELRNPHFASMLRSGVPMEHAYKVLHMNELMNDVMQTSAANTERAVIENVRAKGARPLENGTSNQSSFTVKDDVSKLTKKDRAEIAKRAMRGEKITF